MRLIPPHLAARTVRDRRGVVAMLTALLALPFVLAVGMSVDYARMAQFQTTLQDAVDNAALAGATVYSAATQSGAAVSVATNYMSAAPLPAGLSLGTPTVTAATGTTNFNASSYNVTVTASATMKPTFLSIAYASFTLTATATASNPIVQLTLSAGNFGASAEDWNSTYLYAVPMSNGKPVYTSIPPVSAMYEIGSNCNKASVNYSSSSLCVGQSGATVPAGQTLPTITATQPIAFALRNMTDGLASGSSGGSTSVTAGNILTGLSVTVANTSTSAGNTNIGYGVNSYNAPPGFTNWFYSAYEALSQPPSQTTNYSYTQTTTTKVTTTTLRGSSSTSASVSQTVTTTYPTASSSVTPNCSLLVQQVDPNNLPSSPPVNGRCFAVTDATSGYQYAAMTCAQMGGKTYMFWWNDMGGPSDDRDYNDAYYTVSCTGNGTGSGTGNTQVVLTK